MARILAPLSLPLTHPASITEQLLCACLTLLWGLGTQDLTKSKRVSLTEPLSGGRTCAQLPGRWKAVGRPLGLQELEWG